MKKAAALLLALMMLFACVSAGAREEKKGGSLFGNAGNTPETEATQEAGSGFSVTDKSTGSAAKQEKSGGFFVTDKSSGSEAAQADEPSANAEAETQEAPATALAADEWLSPDQYYYQQLSDEHKAAWANDIANVLAYPDQSKAEKNIRQQALASMIKADNPRIFWVDWIDSTAMLRFDTGSTPHYEGVKLPGGATLAEYQTLFAQGVEDAVDEIAQSLPEDADAKAKVRAIYAWLCDNNSYNDAQTSKHKSESDPVAFAYLAAHSAYSAIIPGDDFEPVCDGYGGAFKVLCDELGVPCICVCGSMTSVSSHMWNYVQLESGDWYLVDATTGDVYDTDMFCLMKASEAKKYEYTPNPYLYSGVNPDNGYSEGAAFTVPELAKK